LQEHLVRCRDCFDLAEAAAAFAPPDEGLGAGSEVESAALWRLLRPQLDTSPRNVREITAGSRRRSWVHRLPIGLAATFFVALVGVSAWSVHRESVLRAPKANVPIFEIAADERATSGPELTFATGPRMLVLHPAEELPVYRMVIRDAASAQEVFTAHLKPNRDLVLTYYLPEGLRPGRYRLELSDGAGKLIETHRLRITEPGRGA
jgi:hypothetical protein